MTNIIPSISHEGLNRDCFKTPTRFKLGKNRKALRWCKRHEKAEPSTSRCFRSVPNVKAPTNGTYRPWLNNVLCDNGGVMIHSKEQHRQLCKAKGLLCPE